MQLIQNDTTRGIMFLLLDSVDHLTRKTGILPGDMTIKLGKNGAAGAAPTGVVTEISAATLPGWYLLTPSVADVSVAGGLALQVTAAGCDQVDDLHEVLVPRVAADIKAVNGVTVNGDGSTTPWGP